MTKLDQTCQTEGFEQQNGEKLATRHAPQLEHPQKTKNARQNYHHPGQHAFGNPIYFSISV